MFRCKTFIVTYSTAANIHLYVLHCDFPLEFCQTLDIVKEYIVKEEEATLLAPNLIIAVWQKQFPPPISVINHQKTVCGRTSALFAVVTAEAINKGTARL